MNSESDDQLDRIKSEIRADADALRLRAPLPDRAADGGPGDTSPGAQRTSIPALARHAGPAFVDNAYRTILGREPDPDGFERQMAALGAGAGKIEILGDLRYSAEGKRNGIGIPGLWPRYVLAKLGRVPVLGAIVQWVMAAVALPHLLRHQRATEASLAVRFGETERALQAAAQRLAEAEQRLAEAEQRDAELRSDLSAAVEELSDRITRAEIGAHQLRQYVEGVSVNVAELRQLVLTMNHWTVQVRRSIDAIEAAESERRARNDETAAAAILAARGRDAQRANRLEAWADELAQRMERGAAVLDLGGGPDWLAALAARGFDASAIETNTALHRESRARGLNVTLGDPAMLIARIADASLDALTIAMAEHRDFSHAALLAEAQRVLRRGGCLMIAHARSESAQSAPPDIVEAAGFGPPKRLDAFGGRAFFAARA